MSVELDIATGELPKQVYDIVSEYCFRNTVSTFPMVDDGQAGKQHLFTDKIGVDKSGAVVLANFPQRGQSAEDSDDLGTHLHHCHIPHSAGGRTETKNLSILQFRSNKALGTSSAEPNLFGIGWRWFVISIVLKGIKISHLLDRDVSGEDELLQKILTPFGAKVRLDWAFDRKKELVDRLFQGGLVSPSCEYNGTLVDNMIDSCRKIGNVQKQLGQLNPHQSTYAKVSEAVEPRWQQYIAEKRGKNEALAWGDLLSCLKSLQGDLESLSGPAR